jgi:hypothetical protein
MRGVRSWMRRSLDAAQRQRVACRVPLFAGWMLAACGPMGADVRRADTAATSRVTPSALIEPDATDTLATVSQFERRVSAIINDSSVQEHVQVSIDLGAGATGQLHGWRAGPVWRRLRLDGEGAGFRSVDEYWLEHGTLLGARLELRRTNTRTNGSTNDSLNGSPNGNTNIRANSRTNSRTSDRPQVDQIWFRTNALYRWTDRDGRVMNPASRSTQFEVRMLRARLDSLVHHLSGSGTPAP